MLIDNVMFRNKRSQAKVFTVYLSLEARHSYLECNDYNVTLCTWSTNVSQYFTQSYTIYTSPLSQINILKYLYTLKLHWPVRNQLTLLELECCPYKLASPGPNQEHSVPISSFRAVVLRIRILPLDNKVLI